MNVIYGLVHQPGDRQGVSSLFWKYVLTFGLMSAAWNAIWGIYNNYVPIFLQAGNPGYDLAHKATSFGFGLSPFWAGIVMSVDNFAGLILCPLIGAFSDRVHRRSPFILVGAPLAIAGSAILPLVTFLITQEKSGNLSALVLPFGFFVLCASILILGYLTTSLLINALILDIIPSQQQTKIFSYILVIASSSTLLVYLTSSRLYQLNRALPFAMGAIILLVALAAFKAFIHEPRRDNDSEPSAQPPGVFHLSGLFAELGKLPREEARSLISMVLTVFFYQFGFAAFQTYVSSYALNVLHTPEANTISISLIWMLGVLLMTVPAGRIAGRIGRRATIRIGLLGNIFFPLLAYFFPYPVLLYAIFLIFGMSFTLISVNQIPVIGGIVTSKTMAGKLVGINWFTVSISTLIAVPLAGWMIGLSGSNFNLLWLIMAATMFIAFLLLFQVKGGEVPASPVE